MSEKCKKEKTPDSDVKCSASEQSEAESLLSAVIGSSNLGRWLRIQSLVPDCENNEIFVQFLLDLAAKYLIKSGRCQEKDLVEGNDRDLDAQKHSITEGANAAAVKPKKRDCRKEYKHKKRKDNVADNAQKVVKAEATADILGAVGNDERMLKEVDTKQVDAREENKQDEVKSLNGGPTLLSFLQTKTGGKGKLRRKNVKSENTAGKGNDSLLVNGLEGDAMKECLPQTTRHVIEDAISLHNWQSMQAEECKTENVDAESAGAAMKSSYSWKSLPPGLEFIDSGSPYGFIVIASRNIEENTVFGPLIAPRIKEVDVPEDCNMRHIFELAKSETERLYFNCENENECNWMRFLRPAPVREVRNFNIISENNMLFFSVSQAIKKGDELLYWQDDVFTTNKKKLEKTNCGGCNMAFLHPIYYRIHCSVFHDIRYSLTIRKYHCKVCGAAVLGKENIMKHASELHNGQGAYQCQFCKKFFLRLNYLEMHRTYGCSANPQRSRPLCDFCGRKFCQPQKLKVHIKRMHSDMSEVLKEFQCKNCMKILGSRAALQRHMKEVHQKQMDGAYACSKCGKLFQNKSNLKIHMLTHSGIKPFRCNENKCAAGFTTKQCLQFHYKKVHNLTEDLMPRIERSVNYTFEAYSGGNDFSDLSSKQDQHIDNAQESEVEESPEKKSVPETAQLKSPTPELCVNNDASSESPALMIEAYATPNLKIHSKGSKKWIEDSCKPEDKDEIVAETVTPAIPIQATQFEDASKLDTSMEYRHESNASLLVEAALDSVCSEPNIDIDVSTTPNCTDSLVNNLYTLSHSDSLVDVTYSQSVDVTDTRDINLISPSVNEQISVTDDIGDDLRHSQTIGIDYSSFHHGGFSPNHSPRNNFREYMNASPQNLHTSQATSHVYDKISISPVVASPPRYDFGSNVAQESDDSNGIGVQNLSLHADKFSDVREGVQLDLSIYKSHYSFDSTFLRKEPARGKFDIDVTEHDVQLEGRKSNYLIENEDTNKFSLNGNVDNDNLDNELKDFDDMDDGKSEKGCDVDLSLRSNASEIRSKFDFDLDLRKTYEIDAELRRNVYDNSLDEFRIKNYDLDSNLDALRSNLERKTYESLIEDFRTDRNFEPLVLNPSELQGLDMSARGYHNYPNLNRYHHLYGEVDRPSVDLRLNYSPPAASYTHPDILRVSLDLAPPGRHSVDLSLRSQIANSRLLSEHSLQSSRLALDQSRLLSSQLSAPRHMAADTRLISDINNRILSDHTTNRLLSNDQLAGNRLICNEQRILPDESRLIEQPRLLDQNRLLAPTNGSLSPVSFTGYSVSPSPYHPTALPARPHVTSPNPGAYHHYSAYY